MVRWSLVLVPAGCWVVFLPSGWGWACNSGAKGYMGRVLALCAAGTGGTAGTGGPGTGWACLFCEDVQIGSYMSTVFFPTPVLLLFPNTCFAQSFIIINLAFELCAKCSKLTSGMFSLLIF